MALRKLKPMTPERMIEKRIIYGINGSKLNYQLNVNWYYLVSGVSSDTEKQ